MSGIQKIRRKIGDNIRSLRKHAGLTQEKLAEIADLHPVYISQVECGKKAVSVEALWKISQALRVPMSTLVKGV